MRGPVPAAGLCCLVGRRCCHLVSCGCRAVQQVCNTEPASCIGHQPVRRAVLEKSSTSVLMNAVLPCKGCAAGVWHCASKLQQVPAAAGVTRPRCTSGLQYACCRPSEAVQQVVGCGLHAFSCQIQGDTWVQMHATGPGKCCTLKLARLGYCWTPAVRQATSWETAVGCQMLGAQPGLPTEQPLRCPSLCVLPRVHACYPLGCLRVATWAGLFTWRASGPTSNAAQQSL